MVEPRRPFPKAHIHLSVQTVSVNKVFGRCGLHATVAAVDFIGTTIPASHFTICEFC